MSKYFTAIYILFLLGILSCSTGQLRVDPPFDYASDSLAQRFLLPCDTCNTKSEVLDHEMRLGSERIRFNNQEAFDTTFNGVLFGEWKDFVRNSPEDSKLDTYSIAYVGENRPSMEKIPNGLYDCPGCLENYLNRYHKDSIWLIESKDYLAFKRPTIGGYSNYALYRFKRFNQRNGCGLLKSLGTFQTVIYKNNISRKPQVSFDSATFYENYKRIHDKLLMRFDTTNAKKSLDNNATTTYNIEPKAVFDAHNDFGLPWYKDCYRSADVLLLIERNNKFVTVPYPPSHEKFAKPIWNKLLHRQSYKNRFRDINGISLDVYNAIEKQPFSYSTVQVFIEFE